MDGSSAAPRSISGIHRPKSRTGFLFRTLRHGRRYIRTHHRADPDWSRGLSGPYRQERRHLQLIALGTLLLVVIAAFTGRYPRAGITWPTEFIDDPLGM